MLTTFMSAAATGRTSARTVCDGIAWAQHAPQFAYKCYKRDAHRKHLHRHGSLAPMPLAICTASAPFCAGGAAAVLESVVVSTIKYNQGRL